MKAFRKSLYGRVWISIVLSSFGIQIISFCMPLAAGGALNASATQMGIISVVTILPIIFFSIPAGFLSDRFRSLPLYIVGEVSLSAISTIVAVLSWFHAVTIYVLYAAGFIIGTVGSFYGIVSQKVILCIIDKDEIIRANAANASAYAIAQIAGPAIAGVIISYAGVTTAFFLNAMIFIVSSSILLGLNVNEDISVKKTEIPKFIKIGFAKIYDNRDLITVSVLVSGWLFASNIAMSVLVIYGLRVLELSDKFVGLSYAGLGVGSVIGSMIGANVIRTIGVGRCLSYSIALGSLGIITAALAQSNDWSEVVFTLSLIMFGIANVAVFINFNSFRQKVIPVEYIGSVTGVLRCMILLPTCPGAMLGGWLGNYIGLRGTLVLAGLAGMLLAGITLRWVRYIDLSASSIGPKPI